MRINAEDPRADFRPSPGTLTRFRPPLGPGVRVDTFVEEGSVIPPYYDSMIAKVIVLDNNRELAIGRARRALEEFEIEGVPTTRDVIHEILGGRHLDFAEGLERRRVEDAELATAVQLAALAG